MAGTSIQVGRSLDTNRDPEARIVVALVAVEDARVRIGEALRRQQLEFAAFDSVEDLLESGTEAPVIALWIDDALSPSHRRSGHCKSA